MHPHEMEIRPPPAAGMVTRNGRVGVRSDTLGKGRSV